MTTPNFTIAIMARNEERNIAPAIESLKKDKAIQKCEILVIDGQSTDRTVEIAKKLGTRVVIQKNLGMPNARNLGWKHAKGKVVIFIEGDHRAGPSFLSRIIKHVQNSRADAWRPNVTPTAKNLIQKALTVQIELNTLRQKGKTTPVIYRKRVLQKIGGWDETMGLDDRDLPVRVRKAGYKIEDIPDAVLYTIPVSSFRQLYNQGRWYGRIFPAYSFKTRDFLPMAAMLVYAAFVPLVVLSFFSNFFLILLAIDFLILLAYSLQGFIVTRKPIALLMVPVNIVRGFGELVGMISIPFKKGLGRVNRT